MHEYYHWVNIFCSPSNTGREEGCLVCQIRGETIVPFWVSTVFRDIVVAALGNGQILASDYYGNLAWYRSVLEPAVLLTNTPITGSGIAILGSINQFLVTTGVGSQLYFMDGDGKRREISWHAVDGLK